MFSGKLAFWLGVALVFSSIISVVFAFAIGGKPEVIESSRVLSIFAAILSLIITLSAPLSFFTGIYISIRYKEWKIWKMLVLFYFLTFLFFLIGEFLFPH